MYECEGEVGADKHRGEQEGVHAAKKIGIMKTIKKII